uniref:Uncharacterized LOC115590181 n=2 Tax=Sparus aurata TaxID=8175 RepID=A0A671XV52_SPAAU
MAQTTVLKFSSSGHQERRFVSVTTGDKLILQCLYKDDVVPPRLRWYKQTLRQNPRLISNYYKYEKNVTFYDEFKNNPRFTLDTENGKNHLMITDLNISDSATYFCLSFFANELTFLEDITVSVKGSGLNVPARVHQSASGNNQPGGSVTLNCTVHTGTCDGEHSVYWFKHSQESQPGLIYTRGGRNNQCERKDNTQTHTCVYTLPMESLSLSHAGTYYCAVASCGHILFGDATKLASKDEVDRLALVYFLSGALTFTTVLVVLLALSVYKMKKRNSCQSTESQAGFSPSSTENAEGHQEAENLHYAALRVNKAKRTRRQRNNTNNDCVYSSVKL